MSNSPKKEMGRWSKLWTEIWIVWKYTIGSYSDEKTAAYDDIVACLRTCLVTVNFITCFFIMSNIIHNW
jgi:hypothetical protein